MSAAPGRVSVVRTAGWGAILGAPLLLAKAVVLSEPIPAQTAALSGFLLGGMVIGAAVGAFFAVLKNKSQS
jgi:hypothetical protein